MVNPGAFQGARKTFLMGEKPGYAAAVQGGYAADQLALIQRQFFKRFPIDKGDTYEPTMEEIEAVDDGEAEADDESADRGALSEKEYEEEQTRVKERRKLIDFKRGQIKRWLVYQYMKDADIDPKETGAENPYRALLHKLTGQGLKRPRKKTAVNIWRKSQRDSIESAAKARVGLTQITKGKYLALLDKIAKEEFLKLPVEEQSAWAEIANEENEAANISFEQGLHSPASTLPEDRQRCIEGLVRFMEPILDLVCEATGWKASFMAGGPEPAVGGRLNVISVHSGETSGDVKLTFGRAERVRYKKFIVPIFGSFLQSCYTPDECRSRAISSEGDCSLLNDEDLGEAGASMDRIDFDTSGVDDRPSGSEGLQSNPVSSTTAKTSSTMASSISAKKPTTTHSPTKKMAIATTPSTATTSGKSPWS
ncbi:hypothetical protein NLJ89_g11753 [Agrocybe chaxingu]|uniref:Uncharacterized protein n=1 Tax=Agrocybe chaxingu TaxID=84603 RepID=A0A9W8JW69_9AGAR|nr:hypothetical protein NLJ89_g11753 [Agrocybe chaxingu]